MNNNIISVHVYVNVIIANSLLSDHTGVIYCRVLVKKCPGCLLNSVEIRSTCDQLYLRSCFLLRDILLVCIEGNIESRGLSISLHWK